MDAGFIGLGLMGSAMAANLAKAGHIVRAWNRSGGKDIPGVEMVLASKNAFQGDAVFTMLSDDAAIRKVLLDSGVLDSAERDIVHVVTATISVEFAGELAALHETAGIGYVSAPVLGRPDVAREGQLNILTGGKPAAVEKVRPLLDVLGKRVWMLGDAPQNANVAKIAANMMITMAIEAMAEAVARTESSGVSRDRFFELILGTLFGGRAYESYSANIAKGHYEPGFKAKLGLKDLRLATAVAETTGKSLPMLDAVRGRMIETIDAGMAEKDWSAMAAFTLSQAKTAAMPVTMYVTYPGNAETRFDRDYYVREHLPLVIAAWERYGLLSCDAFFPASDPSKTIAIAERRFRDEAALLAALDAPETPQVMADVIRFTDATPTQSRERPVR